MPKLTAEIYIRKRHDRRTLGRRKGKCPTIQGNQKRCFDCGKWRPLSDFSKFKPGSTRAYAGRCKKCETNHVIKVNLFKKVEKHGYDSTLDSIYREIERAYYKLRLLTEYQDNRKVGQ